jgi:hypothetical protein
MGPTDLAELTTALRWTDGDGNGAVAPGAGNERAVRSSPAGDSAPAGGPSETGAVTDGTGDAVTVSGVTPTSPVSPGSATRTLGEPAVGSDGLWPAATYD